MSNTQRRFSMAVLAFVTLLAVGSLARLSWMNGRAVRTAEDAIAIAIPVFETTYGHICDIESEGPYVATYDQWAGTWHVHGTLPEGYCGGVPEATVFAGNGEVLKVWHGR